MFLILKLIGLEVDCTGHSPHTNIKLFCFQCIQPNSKYFFTQIHYNPSNSDLARQHQRENFWIALPCLFCIGILSSWHQLGRKTWSEVSRGNDDVRREEDVLSRNILFDGLDVLKRVSDSIHSELELCHAKSEAVLCASHISVLCSSCVSLLVCQSVCCLYQLPKQSHPQPWTASMSWYWYEQHKLHPLHITGPHLHHHTAYSILIIW